jgi:hypothetical protein
MQKASLHAIDQGLDAQTTQSELSERTQEAVKAAKQQKIDNKTGHMCTHVTSFQTQNDHDAILRTRDLSDAEEGQESFDNNTSIQLKHAETLPMVDLKS